MTDQTPNPSPSPDAIASDAPGSIATKAAVISPSTQTVSASTADTKDRLDFLWRIHSYSNEYIKTADAKAGFAAGSVLAIMGALIGSHAFDSVRQAGVAQQHNSIAFGALALLILSFSFISDLIAIRPRFKSTLPRNFIFWTGIVEHGSETAYAEGCARLSLEQMELDISKHIYALAVISKRKYYWTHVAILSGFAGGLMAGAVMLASHFAQRA